MAYRSFNDFSEIIPFPSDYIVGFRPLQGEFKINFYTLSQIISGGITNTVNVFFVSPSGDDSNRGITESQAFKTIKKACYAATTNPGKYTIFVKTGEYSENNPVYVPPNTSIIGDNLRRVSVFPKNPTYDMFWVTNANYIWGMTFRAHRSPSAAIAFPNLNPSNVQYAYAFQTGNPSLSMVPPTNRPFITTSPYIQGCSSITNSSSPGANDAGCGLRIDGSLTRGYLRSMVIDSYTQFNEGGIGIHIINNGYAQLVSTFTIACTYGVLVSAGGGCDVNTSNCSFGNYGLAAFGKSPTPVLSGTLARSASANDQYIEVNNAIPTDLANTPGLGLIFQIDKDDTNYIISSAANIGTNKFNVYIEEPTVLSKSLSAGSPVKFYIRSNILASAITFEYIGTGTTLANALPILGGQTKLENEVVTDDVGVVFFTATNQSGDFRVGDEFTIKQATGTIEGRTFQRSIFSLVTPFVLSIE